jgi:hypothetical protein
VAAESTSALTHRERPQLTVSKSESLPCSTPKTLAPSTKLPRIRVHSSSHSPHPPALPPPRRSSHSVPPPPPSQTESNPNSVHRQQPHPRPSRTTTPVHGQHSSPQTPTTSTALPSPPDAHPRKPDPPKTRRWRVLQAHLHAQDQLHAAHDSHSSPPSTASNTPADSAVPSPRLMAATTVTTLHRTEIQRMEAEAALDKVQL